MTDNADPVQQAREWLAANGAPIPEPDPAVTPADPGSGVSSPKPGTAETRPEHGPAATRPEPDSAATRPEPVEGPESYSSIVEADGQSTLPGEATQSGADATQRGGATRQGGGATKPGGFRSRRGRRRQEEPDDRHDGTDADPETLARTIVLRKLTGQARTRDELSRALAERDVPDEAAEAVLDRMEDVGLVDDQAFARDWVESRQSRRQLSKSALRRELITKGVDRDHIDAALADVDDEDELEAARSLALKKVRGMSQLEPQVRYRRLAGALARRGFSSGTTARILDEVLSDGGRSNRA